jgi:putative toxin-antitoxin system antitoxin component (TIGR02293 family)
MGAKKRAQPAALGALSAAGRGRSGLRKLRFGEVYRAGALERVELIKAGVAPAAVDDIAQAMGAPQETVIRNLGIPKSTWARKRAQHAPLESHASEKVVGLAALIGQVETLAEEQGAPAGFDAAKWFRDWMRQPVPALGGRRPVELLDTREGQRIVSELLDAIRAGAYL